MSQQYTIHQSLNEETVRKAASKLLFTRKLTILMLVLIIFSSINAVNIYDGFNETEYSILTFFPFIICFVLIIALLFFFKKKIKNDYRKNIRFYRNITFTFSSEGMFAKGEGFENRMPWNDFEKITETEDWFLLYRNKVQYQIIDKKQITDFSIEDLKSFFRSLNPKVKVSLK
ncbi:hypothetical protein HYN59_08015 [Flavobacterium album]|uniref:YcxB-like C-terminal domain-containing protein n=1 Tax=Flavobacterium album TaxID=2175091 RepID=A0A2S1QXG1_9FLAO|nr:YcxB family protein [Flavobacterium album]AWH85074.1 hypothetical protein HYN59_08015 [Flavobacterium album]